jgi:hypothetical protein
VFGPRRPSVYALDFIDMEDKRNRQKVFQTKELKQSIGREIAVKPDVRLSPRSVRSDG